LPWSHYPIIQDSETPVKVHKTRQIKLSWCREEGKRYDSTTINLFRKQGEARMKDNNQRYEMRGYALAGKRVGSQSNQDD